MKKNHAAELVPFPTQGGSYVFDGSTLTEAGQGGESTPAAQAPAIEAVDFSNGSELELSFDADPVVTELPEFVPDFLSVSADFDDVDEV